MVEAMLVRAGAPRPRPYWCITSFNDYSIGPARRALWALLGAVSVLLLISCANVSGLMLTRVSLKRREHSIRLALGASAADLARSWIIETAVLCTAGGVLGLIATRWLYRGLIALAPGDMPRLGEVAVGWPRPRSRPSWWRQPACAASVPSAGAFDRLCVEGERNGAIDEHPPDPPLAIRVRRRANCAVRGPPRCRCPGGEEFLESPRHRHRLHAARVLAMNVHRATRSRRPMPGSRDS